MDGRQLPLGHVHRPLLGDTIHANLAATVARFGDREALVDKATDRRWTYAELSAEVDKAAAGLTSLGVRKGDRVGIWAPNCAEWVFVQYATARIGAILVNVNPAYRVHELEYVLNQARPGWDNGFFATRDLRHRVVYSLNPTGRGSDLDHVVAIVSAALSD